MPFYEIHHTLPLNPSQIDTFASSLTRIHTRLFSTPAQIVNIAFSSTSASSKITFVAGKRRAHNNFIVANVRAGPGRTREHFNVLCEQINEAWKGVVGVQTDENSLRAVFVLGSVVLHWEQGFKVPPAGGEREWLKGSLGELRRKAEEGDRDVGDMLEELAGREEFGDVFKEGS